MKWAAGRGSSPPDTREILRDLSELTRAEVDACADEEESEVAYAGLVEYLRVATLIAREALQAQKLL